MKIYSSSDSNFSFIFPDDWTYQEDADVLSVYDSTNGVGALQFSSYYVNDIATIDLKVELEDYVSGRHQTFSVQRFDKYAFCQGEDKKGKGWKYWVFARGNTVIFASYNCLTEDVGKEDQEINAIVKSAMG